MNTLTAFGLFAVTAMLVCYAFEGPLPLVDAGFRLRLSARVGLRFFARGMAVWSRGMYMGRNRRATLVVEKK